MDDGQSKEASKQRKQLHTPSSKEELLCETMYGHPRPGEIGDNCSLGSDDFSPSTGGGIGTVTGTVTAKWTWEKRVAELEQGNEQKVVCLDRYGRGIDEEWSWDDGEEKEEEEEDGNEDMEVHGVSFQRDSMSGPVDEGKDDSDAVGGGGCGRDIEGKESLEAIPPCEESKRTASTEVEIWTYL